MAGAILRRLAPVLQADAVVATGDMAVGNTYVAGVVEVDTVAIADFEIVEQVDAIDDSTVTSHKVECPVGSVAYGHIAHHDISHIGEGDDMRTGVEGGDGFQFVGVVEFGAHKSHTIAADGSHTGDRDILGMLGINPHHSLAFVVAKCAEMVNRLIGIGKKCSSGLKMEFDVGFQLYRASEEGVVGG